MAATVLFPVKTDTTESILANLEETWNLDKGVFAACEFTCRILKKCGVDPMLRCAGTKPQTAEGIMTTQLNAMYANIPLRNVKYALYFTLWRGKVEVEHERMEPAFERFFNTTFKALSLYGNTDTVVDMRRALFIPPHPKRTEFKNLWKTLLTLTGSNRAKCEEIMGVSYSTVWNWISGVQKPRTDRMDEVLHNMQAGIDKLINNRIGA